MVELAFCWFLFCAFGIELTFCWSSFCAFGRIGVMLFVFLCILYNCCSVGRHIMRLVELAFCCRQFLAFCRIGVFCWSSFDRSIRYNALSRYTCCLLVHLPAAGNADSNDQWRSGQRNPNPVAPTVEEDARSRGHNESAWRRRWRRRWRSGGDSHD